MSVALATLFLASAQACGERAPEPDAEPVPVIVRIAVTPEPTKRPARTRNERTAGPSQDSHPSPRPGRASRCGGDLPPCWVMNRESGGNIRAVSYPGSCVRTRSNPRGYCYGKWQFDPGTYGGNAANDSEEEQDRKARELWNGGRGCSHWNAC